MSAEPQPAAPAPDPLFSLAEIHEFIEASMEDSDAASAFILGEDWDSAVASIFFVKGAGAGVAAAWEIYCVLGDLGYLTAGKPVSGELPCAAPVPAPDPKMSGQFANVAAMLDLMLPTLALAGALPPSVARWICHLLRRAALRYDAGISGHLEFPRLEAAIRRMLRGAEAARTAEGWRATPAPPGYPPMRVEDVDPEQKGSA